MLAIVDFADGERFLCGDDLSFLPYSGAILVSPCESPLRHEAPHDGGTQPELF
jgi:hypothetical protein